MTPNELAAELGISPKTLRSYLRGRYGKLSDQSKSHWELDDAQISLARSRFGGQARISEALERPPALSPTHKYTGLDLEDLSSRQDWRWLLSLPRIRSSKVRESEIPPAPGLYVWFRGDECIYVGISGNLRQRLSIHRDERNDLSRSTFRSWAAVEILGVEREVTRQRPSVMTNPQIQAVNRWISECDLAWQSLPSRAAAVALETALLGERRPRFNAK